MPQDLIPLKLTGDDEAKLARSGYQLGDLLGSGGFGVVYHATWYQMPCACKMIDVSSLNNSQQSKYLPMEIFMLNKLKHPHIVPVFDIFMLTTHQLLIFMELGEGGDLHHYLRQIRQGLCERHAICLYRQFGSAFLFMHQLGFAHRDIKPLNLLLDRTAQRCKVSDFGLSSAVFDLQTGATLMTQSFVGTITNMAPEMIRMRVQRGGFYCPKAADVWSTGIMLFAMLNYKSPFKSNTYKVNDKRNSFDYKAFLADQMTLSSRLHKVLDNKELTIGAFKMLWLQLQPKPEKRPSFEELMSQDWLKTVF